MAWPTMQPLWQGLGHVVLLRRLTALEQRALAEPFKHRLARSLGAIDHHQDGAAAGQNADKFGVNLVGEPLTASSFCGANCYLALRRWRWARMPAFRVTIQNRHLAKGASLVKPLVCQKLMVDIVGRPANGESALPSCLRRCAAVMGTLLFVCSNAGGRCKASPNAVGAGGWRWRMPPGKESMSSSS